MSNRVHSNAGSVRYLSSDVETFGSYLSGYESSDFHDDDGHHDVHQISRCANGDVSIPSQVHRNMERDKTNDVGHDIYLQDIKVLTCLIK